MGKQSYRFEQYSPVIAMVAVQCIYASLVLSAKAVFAAGVNPMVFVVYRQSIATVVLAPAAILNTRRSDPASLGIKGFGLIFLAALVGVTINQASYYHGLKLASASLASASTNTIPAITFSIAASLGMERLKRRSIRSIAKVVGTIICVGGAITMALFKGHKLMNPPNSQTLIPALHLVGENWKLGCLFLLGSSCCWSVWIILQVPICKNYVDPLSFSSWMCLLSAVQSAIVTFYLEPDLKAWRLNSTFELMCCLYAGVIGSGVTFYLQSWCISRRGPLFSAMFSPLCTVIVTVLATVLLHEHLYIGSMLGAIAVMVGLYVVLWGKAKDFEDDQSSRMPITNDQPSMGHEANIKETLLIRKLEDDKDCIAVA